MADKGPGSAGRSSKKKRLARAKIKPTEQGIHSSKGRAAELDALSKAEQMFTALNESGYPGADRKLLEIQFAYGMEKLNDGYYDDAEEIFASLAEQDYPGSPGPGKGIPAEQDALYLERDGSDKGYKAEMDQPV